MEILLLKLFRSHIEDDLHGCNLEILQATSPKPFVGLNLKLVERIETFCHLKIKNKKMV